jgi:hypothetical protein
MDVILQLCPAHLAFDDFLVSGEIDLFFDAIDFIIEPVIFIIEIAEVRIALQEAARILEYKVFPRGPSAIAPVSPSLTLVHGIPFSVHG